MNCLINCLSKLSFKQCLNKFNLTLTPASTLLNQKRDRGSTVRRIRGPPRPPLPFKKVPKAHEYRFRPILPEDGEYTEKKLKIKKLSGRDPVTGITVVKTYGGGVAKYYRWVDYTRNAPKGSILQEKIYNVRHDPFNTSLLALAGNGDRKRWIIASEFTKPGDIITTHNYIPEIPIKGKEGDSYLVGSLLPGTIVHHIETIPGKGATLCTNAGTHMTILRKLGKKMILKQNDRGEIAIDEKCFVTVGKTSNTNHYTINRVCPNRSRWLGKRPKSGLWHRKDGYCGKKPKKPPSLKVFDSKDEIFESKVFQPIHLLDN